MSQQIFNATLESTCRMPIRCPAICNNMTAELNNLNLDGVAQYYGRSGPTIKRWLMLTRLGLYDFPLPVSPKGCRLLWNREDIINWRSQLGNASPIPEQPAETPTERRRRDDKVARGLEKLGVTIKQKGV